MNRRIAWLFCLVAFSSGNAAMLRGAETSPAPIPTAISAQDLAKQQQIKTTTKRVGDQLEGVLAEFDRNGITGEDVKVLGAIRGVLDRLSEKDMATVLEYLRQSHAANDSTVSTRSATEAYAGQKAIVVQLQQLVLEYQRQQALYEISLRLKELASRQTANMWQGVALAKSTENKTSFAAFDENQRISLRYQQSEQNPLKDETAAILGKLERLAAEIVDGSAASRSKSAVQQAKDGELMPALTVAADELKEEKLKLLSSIGNQKKARDQMREIARLLILSQDTTDALKQAIAELQRAIDAQKKVAAETSEAKKYSETDKLATDQAAVVDDTDLIRRDIDTLAPIAAEYLRTATDKLQESRELLGSDVDPKQRAQDALPKQEEAIMQMQSARRALEEQLAKAEELPEPEQDTLSTLRELLEQVRQLIQKQEAHKLETASAEKKQLPGKAPQQGAMKDAAQSLQARAAKPSPEAAQSLGEASSQMQKSQNSLAQEENNDPAQQAALDALQRAEQELGREIAALEQAEKDLAQIEEMLKRLVAIIEGQQRTQFGTANEATKPMPEPTTVKVLFSQQAELAKETGALHRDSAELVPNASLPLNLATRHMGIARAELDLVLPIKANPKQHEALAELYLAKRAFEERINELRDKLGLPPAQTMDALAEAQKLIEEALKKVNESLVQLQQAPPGLMESLLKQQQEIAAALQEVREDSKNALPVTQAEQAATEATRELFKSNLPKAIELMKATRAAIAQAHQPDSTNSVTPKEILALAPLDQKQDTVQKAAEALLAMQDKASAQAMQSASDALKDANTIISPLTAGAFGQMPAGAQVALQSAQGSTALGSAQAAARQNSPAQQSATSAAQALAQAQAALALAQSGMGSDSAMAKKGEGKGKGGKGKAEGEGQGESQANAQGQGKGKPGAQGNGNKGNWEGEGGADGTRTSTTGSSSFTRLPSRDREALQQSQSEKYPQEYGPLVEQYLRNLSDQATDK